MECTWVFTRGDERLEVERGDTNGEVMLLVVRSQSAPPRTYEFTDLTALMRFQSDMELFLLQTGWSFSEFEPERRTGRERRTFPRINERRRWWTDSPRIYLERPVRRDRRRVN